MERYRKILIKPTQTIKQALKQMDSVSEKTLVVADERDKLLGALTDGDIRRWILKGRSLEQKIDRAMNAHPVVLKQDFDKEKAKQLMVAKQLMCLPVVDDEKIVTGAIWWEELFEKGVKKTCRLNAPVVIMAGGEGLRLAPFTKILPKPLMPIGDQPIIEIIMGRFANYGCRDFHLSVNYKSNIIKAYFSDSSHDYKISYIEEKSPLGTAGSLYFLRKKIKKTFFVSNCDILIEADYADILKFHQENKNKITLIGSMKHQVIPYGVCEFENKGVLKSIREKPEYDFLVSTGMYVMDKTVLADIPRGKVYHMTDLINDYLGRGEKIGVYPISEKSWLDMGQFEVLQEMLKKFEIK